MMQLQEAKLKAEMEKLKLETAIAASTAKLKVFQSHKNPYDPMNEYVESRLPSIDIVCPNSSQVSVPQAQAASVVHISNTEEDEDDQIPDNFKQRTFFSFGSSESNR